MSETRDGRSVRRIVAWSTAGVLLVGVGLLKLRSPGPQARREPVGAAAPDAAISPLTAASDAAPWGANPYEATPVTHLAKVNVADAPSAGLSLAKEGTRSLGLLAVDGQPFLVDSCRILEPLGPGFVRQAAVAIEMKGGYGCDPIFATRGSRLFTSESASEIWALDVATHAVAWSARVDEVPAVQGEPAGASASIVADTAKLAGDLVLYLREAVGTSLVALHESTGDIAWVRPHVLDFAVDGADVFVLDSDADGASGANLSSLDPASGVPRWTTGFPELPQDPPATAFGAPSTTVSVAAGGGKVALARFDKLALVDGTSGKRSATTSIPGAVPTRGRTRLLFHGTELYAYGNDALTRVDPAAGTVVWSVPGFFTSPAHGRDALFVTRTLAAGSLYSVDGAVRALDPATGKELWSYGTARSARSLARLTLRVIDVAGSEILETLDVHSRELTLFQRGPTELSPREKTVNVTLRDAKTAEQIRLLVGAQEVSLDASGHWQGKLSGRGNLWVRPAPGLGETIDPKIVDLEDDQPTIDVILSIDKTFHQACAGP